MRLVNDTMGRVFRLAARRSVPGKESLALVKNGLSNRLHLTRVLDRHT